MRRNLLFLFAAGLLFWSSLASLLPTLPLYIQDTGATKQEIGIIMGSFAIGLLIFRPWLGQLADRQGRKIVLLIGMVVAAIAPIGYVLVKSISLLIALRIFHGISIAAFSTGFNTLVADLAPFSRRGEIIGYMSLVNPIGLAIGPAIGGYLQDTAGNLPLFLLAGGLGCLGLLGIVPIVNPEHQQTQHSHNSRQSHNQRFWQILVSPRVRVPAFVLLIVGLVIGTLHTFAPLFIKSMEIDLNPGLFYTAAAIGSFSVRFLGGRLSDRFGRGLIITVGLVFYALSMIMLWKANSNFTFLLAGIVEGIGGGTLIPMVTAMMADRSLLHERGRVFALCALGFDLGIAIAGPIFGSVAEEVGYPNMFAFVGGLTLLAILVFVTQSGKNLSSSVRFAFGRGEDTYREGSRE